MSQIRRHRLLVDAKLQGALLTHVALYWFYCLLSVGVIATVWIVFAKRPPTSAKLFEELWLNCAPALIGSILLLPLVLLDCLRLSNRFAGPMMRLHRAIKELADGKDTAPVKLREGDFWSQFADDMNRLVARQAAETTDNTIRNAELTCKQTENPVSVLKNPAPVNAASIYGDITA